MKSFFTKFSNKYWLAFLVGSFLFCVAILLLHHYPTGSLGFPKYNDHMRHLRFAYEFLSRGTHIYDTLMYDFASIGNEFMYEWPNIVYLYPLGCVFFFLPFSIIAFSGLLSFAKIANLIILILLAFAHINSYLLARFLLHTSSEKLLRRIFVAFFYLISVWWAFHGQYESVVIFALLMAIYAKNIRNQFLWFTIGFFLKLQVIFLLPLFGYFLWQGFKKGILLSAQYLLSYLMIGSNIFMILMVRHQLIPRITNPIHLAKIITDFSILQALFLLLALVFVTYCLVKRRLWLVCLTTIQVIMLMTVGELQGWYLTILFVTPLFLRSSRDQEIYMVWYLSFLWLMNLLPSLPMMIDTLFRGLL